MSKQISKDNREYWSNKLKNKFSDKKEAIESLHQNQINEQSAKNFPIFKKRLNIEKELLKLKQVQKDFNEYSTSYREVLEKKRDLVRSYYNKLEEKLSGWQETRKVWNNDNIPSFDDKDKTYDLSECFDKFLKELCRLETKKAFYNSKKGQELKQLDELQEKAEDLLHSDMIGAEVLKQIALIAKQNNINMTIPSETVKSLPNG